ncbi:MAG: hypothetical protein IJL30_07095 [Clostridia bacterium]|nr:hypothetical protein [Clostridia bacterium]
MKGNNATCSVEKDQKPAKVDVNEAASLFSRLSPEAQKAIVEMLKDLLKAK